MKHPTGIKERAKMFATTRSVITRYHTCTAVSLVFSQACFVHECTGKCKSLNIFWVCSRVLDVEQYIDRELYMVTRWNVQLAYPVKQTFLGVEAGGWWSATPDDNVLVKHSLGWRIRGVSPLQEREFDGLLSSVRSVMSTPPALLGAYTRLVTNIHPVLKLSPELYECTIFCFAF